MASDARTRPVPDLRAWLQERLSRLLKRKPVEISCGEDFHALGLDSVGYMNLAIAIEEELEIPVTARDIFLHPNIGLLAEYLDHAAPKSGGSTRRSSEGSADYTTVNGGGALSPLFWLNGYEIVELAQALMPPERPVYYLHHQGSDGKPARHRTIPAMVDYYLQAILQVEPDGPYCIGGYSIGGPLAHEIANRLKAMGKEVEILMLVSPVGDPKLARGAYLRHHRQKAAAMNALQRLAYMGRKYVWLYQRAARLSLQRMWRRLHCSSYFLLGRPLPSRLIWSHVQPIYDRALKGHSISRYSGDAVIAHEAAASVEAWTMKMSGPCRVLPPVPVRHLELLEKKYAHLWLEEFLSPLGAT